MSGKYSINFNVKVYVSRPKVISWRMAQWPASYKELPVSKCTMADEGFEESRHDLNKAKSLT
jgi:hypothetical protein